MDGHCARLCEFLILFRAHCGAQFCVRAFSDSRSTRVTTLIGSGANNCQSFIRHSLSLSLSVSLSVLSLSLLLSSSLSLSFSLSTSGSFFAKRDNFFPIRTTVRGSMLFSADLLPPPLLSHNTSLRPLSLPFQRVALKKCLPYRLKWQSPRRSFVWSFCPCCDRIFVVLVPFEAVTAPWSVPGTSIQKFRTFRES